jgi:hypothetical protein
MSISEHSAAAIWKKITRGQLVGIALPLPDEFQPALPSSIIANRAPKRDGAHLMRQPYAQA